MFALTPENLMLPNRDRIYRMGPVFVTRHSIDWAELGPEFDEIIGLTGRRVADLPPLGRDHRYLNPMFSLFAAGDVPERTFLVQAERACTLWMKQLKRVAGRARVRRFQRSESNPAHRMLMTSGVLILGGKFVHIKRLNDIRVPTHA